MLEIYFGSLFQYYSRVYPSLKPSSNFSSLNFSFYVVAYLVIVIVVTITVVFAITIIVVNMLQLQYVSCQLPSLIHFYNFCFQL